MANESAPAPGTGMPSGGNRSASIEPRGVDAGRGASWWSEGWRLYTPSWGIWLLILVILVVITVCLNFIPFIGHLALQLINPIFFGGLMLGCRAIDRGEKLTINYLFAGFSGHAASLLIVGLVYLVAIIAIVLVVAGVLFAFFGVAVLKQLAELGDSNITGLALGRIFMAVAIGGLLFLALLLPVVMSVWFAPALVVLHGAEPLAAMKLSLLGCARNIVPFLVYGVIGILLAIVASIPLMLGWLVLGPVTIASIYTGYCDIFEDAAAAH